MFSMCCAGVTVSAERHVSPIRRGLQEAAGSAEQRYLSPILAHWWVSPGMRS